MTIDLTDTTTGAILEALTQARRSMGGPASGMVLTLIIVTDEAEQDRRRPRGQPCGPRASQPHPCHHHPQAEVRVPAGRRDPGGRDRPG